MPLTHMKGPGKTYEREDGVCQTVNGRTLPLSHTHETGFRAVLLPKLKPFLVFAQPGFVPRIDEAGAPEAETTC